MEKFKKTLVDAGLKVTTQRLSILKALSELKRPMSAQEIQKKLGGKIDLVTLYRTLTTFEENQVVKRVNLHKDAVYYELNTDHHHHIICTDCGTVENFELCDMDKMTKKIVSQASQFKSVKDHAVELFGVCNVCTSSSPIHL